MTTTKEQTMTPTFLDLAAARLSDEPGSLQALGDYLDALGIPQKHDQAEAAHRAAASPSFRAAVEEAAAEPAESDVAEQSGCAHGVLTSTEAAALTCGNVAAPDSQSDRREVPGDRRTSGAPRYSTDPDQSLRDLKRRTRRDLAAEVRRLRRECAKTRRKLRDAEERITELEEAHHG